MAIAVRHIFEPTDDGVFDPEEHRRLANDFPRRKTARSSKRYCLSGH